MSSPEPHAKKTRPEGMDSKELASAVALASLASFSPSTTKHSKQKVFEQPNTSFYPNTSAIDPDELNWAAAGATYTVELESRAPRVEPIPVSPEVRSPIRSIKRVHFATNVNANEKQMEYQTKSRYEFQAVGHHHPSHSFPPVPHPPHPAHCFGMFPPTVARHQPPPPPHANWMAAARMPPPQQRIMQQPFGPHGLRNLHWICDYCNAAAFHTYEEACLHEEACRLHCRQNSPKAPGLSSSLNVTQGAAGGIAATDGKAVGISILDRADSNSMEWYSGSVSLAIPESDSEWLSEINCFVRKLCVEAFSATEEDVLSTSKRGRITQNQVGVRCRFCKHKSLKERAVAAVSYPTSVAGVYESVKRFLRLHLDVCTEIPEDVRSKIAELQSLNVWIPTTRQYWTDSARALGMVDTDEGIRFSCDPKYIRESNQLSASDSSATASSANDASRRDKMEDAQVLNDGDYIVFPEDMRIVPPYVYFLMRQVESCHFSEVDRFVARSKGPIGYAGFQCRHCSGHAGLGKYFPVSAKTLSTNSTSQNIHAHLLKCRKCPEQIKEKLVALKVEKGRSPRLEPGWRKIFFDKVWHRLHG